MPEGVSLTKKSPIPRIAALAARERLAGFPILAITGPRQSGKTTLSRLLGGGVVVGKVFLAAGKGEALRRRKLTKEEVVCRKEEMVSRIAGLSY